MNKNIYYEMQVESLDIMSMNWFEALSYTGETLDAVLGMRKRED